MVTDQSFRRYDGAFSAQPSAVGVIRGEMVAIAEECEMPEQGVQDVKLAVSEAVTNAVMHGSPDEGAQVRTSAFYEELELLITISDTGAGMLPRTDSPGLGVGLSVMATVSKRMEVTYDGGTTVAMVFDCPGGVCALS